MSVVPALWKVQPYGAVLLIIMVSTVVCPGLPSQPVPERKNQCRFTQLGHMPVGTIPPTMQSCLQVRYPVCHPTNSGKSLKAVSLLLLYVVSECAVMFFVTCDGVAFGRHRFLSEPQTHFFSVYYR